MLKKQDIKKMIKGILPEITDNEINGNSENYIPKEDYETVLKNISSDLYNQTEIANKLEFEFRESSNAIKYKTAEIIKKFGVQTDKTLSIDCQNEITLQTKDLRDKSIEIEKLWRKELNEKKRLETLFYTTKELSYRQLAKGKGTL